MSDAHFSLAGKRVWVAGHRGMVGSALVRRLASEDCEILTASRSEVDLTRQAETEEWIAAARPHAVFVAAAKVGGILANDSFPADYLYDNLMLELHLSPSSNPADYRRRIAYGPAGTDE
jgi:GDP-L-fucose synthase